MFSNLRSYAAAFTWDSYAGRKIILFWNRGPTILMSWPTSKNKIDLHLLLHLSLTLRVPCLDFKCCQMPVLSDTDRQTIWWCILFELSYFRSTLLNHFFCHIFLTPKIWHSSIHFTQCRKSLICDAFPYTHLLKFLSTFSSPFGTIKMLVCQWSEAVSFWECIYFIFDLILPAYFLNPSLLLFFYKFISWQ